MAATVLSLLAITASVLASPLPGSNNSTRQWTYAEIPPSTSLVWYPCFTNFTCSILDVPLDYSLPHGHRAYVPIIKLAATATPYLGLAVHNPGGPMKAVDNLVSDPDKVLRVMGPQYDIITFDPRGFGYSLPNSNCTFSSATAASSSTSTFPKRSTSPYTAADGEQLSGSTLNASYFEKSFDLWHRVGADCQASIGGADQAGPHVNTANNARDIISIVDAWACTPAAKKIPNPHIVNYYGMSWGTFLGQTFASMFPDRVGRFILDGNLDPEDWASGNGFKMVKDTDETFLNFFLYCHLAGPSLCEFYTGTTPYDIFTKFEFLILKLDIQAAIAGNWANASAIEVLLEYIKPSLFSAMYFPTWTVETGYGFPLISSALQNTLVPILDSGYDIALALESQGWDPKTAEEPWLLAAGQQPNVEAVVCTDYRDAWYRRGLGEFGYLEKGMEELSWLEGEAMAVDREQCTGWGIEGVGRYTGAFGAKTKNPILFVSNTVDPVTPLQNAENGIKIFPGAQLLSIEGIGHTSLSSMNTCAFTKMQHYFTTGELSGKDNFCKIEAGPWGVAPSSGGLAKRGGDGEWEWEGEMEKMRGGLRGLRERGVGMMRL